MKKVDDFMMSLNGNKSFQQMLNCYAEYYVSAERRNVLLSGIRNYNDLSDMVTLFCNFFEKLLFERSNSNEIPDEFYTLIADAQSRYLRELWDKYIFNKTRPSLIDVSKFNKEDLENVLSKARSLAAKQRTDFLHSHIKFIDPRKLVVDFCAWKNCTEINAEALKRHVCIYLHLLKSKTRLEKRYNMREGRSLEIYKHAPDMAHLVEFTKFLTHISFSTLVYFKYKKKKLNLEDDITNYFFVNISGSIKHLERAIMDLIKWHIVVLSMNDNMTGDEIGRLLDARQNEFNHKSSETMDPKLIGYHAFFRSLPCYEECSEMGSKNFCNGCVVTQ